MLESAKSLTPEAENTQIADIAEIVAAALPKAEV